MTIYSARGRNLLYKGLYITVYWAPLDEGAKYGFILHDRGEQTVSHPSSTLSAGIERIFPNPCAAFFFSQDKPIVVVAAEGKQVRGVLYYGKFISAENVLRHTSGILERSSSTTCENRDRFITARIHSS